MSTFSDLPPHTYNPPEDMLLDLDQAPLFSFIVITYDRPNFLKEAINSILKQTYKNVEIIIVDHDAKEENKKIVNEFLTLNKNIGIVKFPKNYGIYNVVSYCWNAGLMYAAGRFISVLNDDDMISENYAERMVTLFNENPNCLTAAPQPLSVDENSTININRVMPNNRQRYMGGLELAKEIVNGDPHGMFTAPGGIMCFRRTSLLMSGGFDFLCDLTQIFKHSVLGDTGFDPEAKLYWRHHEDQYNKKLVGNGEVFYKRNLTAMTESNLVEFWEANLLPNDAKLLTNYCFKIWDSQCIDILESHLRNGSLYRSSKVLFNIGRENPKLFLKETGKFIGLGRYLPFAIVRTILKPVRLFMPLKYKAAIMQSLHNFRK